MVPSLPTHHAIPLPLLHLIPSVSFFNIFQIFTHRAAHSNIEHRPTSPRVVFISEEHSVLRLGAYSLVRQGDKHLVLTLVTFCLFFFSLLITLLTGSFFFFPSSISSCSHLSISLSLFFFFSSWLLLHSSTFQIRAVAKGVGALFLSF